MKTSIIKSTLTLLLFLGFTGVTAFAQLSSHAGAVPANDELSHAPLYYAPGDAQDASDKDWNSGYIGLGMGPRWFSSTPTDVYYKAIRSGAANYEYLDLGKGHSWGLCLPIIFQPDENGMAFSGQLDGFVGVNSGFGFNIGAGYKVGGAVFSATPMLSLGIHKLWTHIESFDLDSATIPAALIEPGNAAWFVGPNAPNADRGGGGNINYSVTSTFFTLKPQLNISVKAGKFTIFGDLAYNIAYAKTKNSFEMTGMGYENSNDLLYSDLPPQVVSLTNPTDDVLVDGNNVPFKKSPMGLSGLSIQFGMGFNFGAAQ